MQGQDVNVLPRTGPNAIGRLIIGKTQTGVTVAGGQFTLSWKVPDGYSRCTGIYYDPSNDLAIEIYSENVNSNILSNFSSKTGSAIGFVNPDHKQATRDQLTAKITPRTLAATPQDITISLQFE